MLEYLRDKKDVGFFLSIQALMQTCRSATPIREVLLLDSRDCTPKAVSLLSAVSWILMPLKGRTRQRAWAWFQKRGPVSPQNINSYSSSAFSATFQGSYYTGTNIRTRLSLLILHKNKVFLSLMGVIL